MATKEPKKPAAKKETASRRPKLPPEAEKFITAKFEEKSLNCTDQDTCKSNVSDVVMFGEDLFKLLSKASSKKQGWMKSTKAMKTSRGCLVQVTTQQRNPDGSYSVAEALTFVRGLKVEETKDDKGVVVGRTLVSG